MCNSFSYGANESKAREEETVVTWMMEREKQCCVTKTMAIFSWTFLPLLLNFDVNARKCVERAKKIDKWVRDVKVSRSFQRTQQGFALWEQDGKNEKNSRQEETKKKDGNEREREKDPWKVFKSIFAADSPVWAVCVFCPYLISPSHFSSLKFMGKRRRAEWKIATIYQMIF